MIVLMLASLAVASPEVDCLTASEVRSRIIEPLIQLERCRADLLTERRTSDRLYGVSAELAARVAEEQAARVEAEEQARRARRSRPRWAGGGAGAALLVVLLVVLL